MNPLQLEEKLSILLRKSIDIHSLYPNCPTLYFLQKEDIDFVNNELETPSTNLEERLDALIKLFIAFYVDAIPQQVSQNLPAISAAHKSSEPCQEMLVMLAGMLHEAKMIVANEGESVSPYLLAYKNYLAETEQAKLPEDRLDEYYSAQIDSVIQKVINY